MYFRSSWSWRHFESGTDVSPLHMRGAASVVAGAATAVPTAHAHARITRLRDKDESPPGELPGSTPPGAPPGLAAAARIVGHATRAGFPPPAKNRAAASHVLRRDR